MQLHIHVDANNPCVSVGQDDGYQYVFTLAHGGAAKELFYYGDWIRKPGVAICSCNDGLRPVIFKIEAEE